MGRHEWKHPKEYSEEEIRAFLFGWLWVEDNIMKEVREKLKVKQDGKKT